MHEIALAQNILDIALQQGKAAKAKKITSINIAVGQLSHITPESVSLCFGTLSENTIASGAALNLRYIPAELACNACGKTFQASHPPWICPHCHHESASVVSGHECYVESIDIDEE